MGSARVAQKGCIIEKESRERFQEGREVLKGEWLIERS